MFFKKEKSKQQEKGDFYLGVQKIFRIENSADLLAAGKVNELFIKVLPSTSQIPEKIVN